MSDDVFSGHGIEIKLSANTQVLSTEPKEIYKDSFLKVKETLTRIGVASTKSKSLYQTAHLLHKKGRYAILHFKELFLLDGKKSDISNEDFERRNKIVSLLEDWGLLKVVNPEKIQEKVALKKLKVIQFDDKKNWTLCSKYEIGQKKKKGK